MGRKPGSKNRPKNGSADAAEPRQSPNVGHNSELTDDQKQVLWFAAKRRIVALKKDMASITADLRNEYKKLKSDLSILKADVDFALSLEDDDGDAEEAHRRRMMLARWEQHPIGVQADLFDAVDRTPAVDKAYAEGKRAGLAGDACQPHHDPSTEQYKRFMDGFHDGNAVLAKGFEPPEPPPMDLPHGSQPVGADDVSGEADGAGADDAAEPPAGVSRAQWQADIARENREEQEWIKRQATGAAVDALAN